MYNKKPRWTHAQNTMLKKLFAELSDEEIADKLGRTLKAIRRKRARMQLIKASGRGIIKEREHKEDL